MSNSRKMRSRISGGKQGEGPVGGASRSALLVGRDAQNVADLYSRKRFS